MIKLRTTAVRNKQPFEFRVDIRHKIAMRPTCEFSATIILTLDSEAMAGRPDYSSGVRANHRIQGRVDFFAGAMFFPDREWVRPGESAEVTAVFRVFSDDIDKFVPGFRWSVCEADNVVGTAELVERGAAKECDLVRS